MDSSHQCQCITKSGKQCSRNATTGRFCKQHINCETPIAGPTAVPTAVPTAGPDVESIADALSKLSLNEKPKKIIRRNPTKQYWLDRPIEDYTFDLSGKYWDPINSTEYILPNNRAFPKWVTSHYSQYEMTKEISVDCDHKTKEGIRPLFSHQMFITQYMNPVTPYRGILLYHDLGSGKTRTAIATAELHRKAGTKVLVLLPATLKPTWFEELKNWGNEDIRRPNNYSTLAQGEKELIDTRLDQKIQNECYDFVSYNASNTVDQLKKAIGDGKQLNHRLVIVDEVHTLMSMIVSPTGLKGNLIYRILMDATDCKFLFLSATPLLNTAFELGTMFNILRGYINYKGQKNTLFPIDEERFEARYVDLNHNTIKNSDEFKRRILGLVSYYFGGEGKVFPTVNTIPPIQCAFGDYQFGHYLVARSEEIEEDAKKRISKKKKKNFVKSSQKETHNEKEGSTFRIASRLVSNFVLPESINRPKPKNWKQLINLKLDEDPSKWTPEQQDQLLKLMNNNNSTYESFIQQYQETTTDLERFKILIHMIKTAPKSENGGDIMNVDHLSSLVGDNPYSKLINSEDLFYEDIETPESYEQALASVLQAVSKNPSTLTTNLSRYSPKMDAMCRYIMMEEPQGTCFVYSFFRTLEGINLLAAVLQQQGFERLDASVINLAHIEQYRQPITRDHPGRFVIYTGAEELEIRGKIRQIFNHPANIRGEICKVFLGTAAAAEGISLKNIRQVHIMEPHWNEVRIQQVIGRARRICSHYDLPPNQRNFNVYRYHMFMNKEQQYQIGETDTTDQAIYEIALRKEKINQHFLQILKDAAVDCRLNLAHNRTPGNPVSCFAFGEGESTVDAWSPDFSQEKMDIDTEEEYKTVQVHWDTSKQVMIDKNTLLQFKIDPQTHKQILESLRILKPVEVKVNGQLTPIYGKNQKVTNVRVYYQEINQERFAYKAYLPIPGKEGFIPVKSEYFKVI